MQNKFTSMLGIKHPILMAPMFLVSNTKMIIEALNNGITAAFPALNYRTTSELNHAINEIKAATTKPFGVNLIVNKSNPSYKAQLDILIKANVAFIITSLGNPKNVIERCKPHNIKVFCDITELSHAQKVEKLGADAIIAVNQQAGGHSGKLPAETLIPLLKKHCKLPIISAGGVASKAQLNYMLELGADAVSMGTIFIATPECNVNEEYKQAIINYKSDDIVMTNKMSGSPLTVINTPFIQEINKRTSIWDHLLNKNKKLKKFVKIFMLIKGQKLIEKAAYKATYKTVWVAGPVISEIKSIKKIKDIITSLTTNKTDTISLKEVS